MAMITGYKFDKDFLKKIKDVTQAKSNDLNPNTNHRKGNGTGTKKLDGLTKHGDGISPSSGTDPATVNLKIKAIDEVVQVGPMKETTGAQVTNDDVPAGRPSPVKGKAAHAKALNDFLKINTETFVRTSAPRRWLGFQGGGATPWWSVAALIRRFEKYELTGQQAPRLYGGAPRR
ncbi:hypothetical protein RND71_040374 [Anisodus tanguticus]|uniref:Uncharacterized protein n=1 Tax=Anisodus tanguticus TaxID=243964 RepID=A0AAE1QVH6_9SOLA|nr:hypothetical protein RND71_040374 [Anisodus tanguticus]